MVLTLARIWYGVVGLAATLLGAVNLNDRRDTLESAVVLIVGLSTLAAVILVTRRGLVPAALTGAGIVAGLVASLYPAVTVATFLITRTPELREGNYSLIAVGVFAAILGVCAAVAMVRARLRLARSTPGLG